MGTDTYRTGGFNPGNTSSHPAWCVVVEAHSREDCRATLTLRTRGTDPAIVAAVEGEAAAITAAEPNVSEVRAYQRAVMTVTAPTPRNTGGVTAEDVAALLPASDMAVRAVDEYGWHRVSRAERDGFRAICSALIPLVHCARIDAWSDIHDEGTSYCSECIALDQGEWTYGRYPDSDAAVYVIAHRNESWSRRADALRRSLGIPQPGQDR